MSIDNNGILFLGLPQEELDLSSLNLDPKYVEDNGIVEAIWTWVIDNKSTLKAQPDNGYSQDVVLVGFELANSNSYGYKEVTNLALKIEDCTR